MMTDDRLEQLLRDARPAAQPAALPAPESWRRVRAQIAPQRRTFGVRWLFVPALATACVVALILVKERPNDRPLGPLHMAVVPPDQGKPVSAAKLDEQIRHVATNGVTEYTVNRKTTHTPRHGDAEHPLVVHTVTCGTGYMREITEQNGQLTVVTRGARPAPPLYANVAAPRRNSAADEQAVAEQHEPSALERATVVRSANTLANRTVVTLPNRDHSAPVEEQPS